MSRFGRMAMGEATMVPATPAGIMTILQENKIEIAEYLMQLWSVAPAILDNQCLVVFITGEMRQ